MRITKEQAKKLLSNGEVVAVPTDTVYGLAASIEHLNAVQKIYSLKGRDLKNPMIILGACEKDLAPFVKEFPPRFHELAKKYWPGPLTLIVPANTELVPEIVRTGLPTIGLRVPDHEDLQDLLKMTGPLVVTSANLSGEDAAKTEQEVAKTFSEDFPVMENTCNVKGIASTILIFENGEWKTLRKGPLTINVFFKKNIYTQITPKIGL